LSGNVSGHHGGDGKGAEDQAADESKREIGHVVGLSIRGWIERKYPVAGVWPVVGEGDFGYTCSSVRESGGT
jgi:hypothetical protein